MTTKSNQPEFVAEIIGKTLDHLIDDDHEIVSIIEGEGSSAPTTRHITQWLADHRPDCATEVHHGGQPLYPYLFGIE